MSQSKLESWIEALANIVVGFTINFFANLIILPWFGFNITAGKAFGIGLVFTAISLLRSYWLRRLFNKYGGGGWVALWRTIKDRNNPLALAHQVARNYRKLTSKHKDS